MSIDIQISPTLRLLNMLPVATREQMVVMYRAMLTVQMGELEQALKVEDPTAVEIAHKIAGSAGMMQDQPLSISARAVEHALREDRQSDLFKGWREVKRCASETLASLDAAMPHIR